MSVEMKRDEKGLTWSKYNVLVPYEDRMIVFNPISGAIGLLGRNTVERVNKKQLREEEVETLRKKGILVEAAKDEREQIDKDRKNGILNSKRIPYRIWTTSACNANCEYCFEKGMKAESMTQETADQVYSFISQSLGDTEELRIEWFGGEPLLNTRVIDYLTQKLRQVCQDKKIRYSSTITSNGSLITRDIVRKMWEDWYIEKIQITLDGDRELYDRIKSYNDPKTHNFDTVIDGILMLINSGIKVNIRLNYTGENFESLKNLISYLDKKITSRNNIIVYVYPVWGIDIPRIKGRENSSVTFDERLIELFDLIVRCGFNSPKKIARLGYRKQACIGYHHKACTILPDGRISKCCETFFQTIGNVCEGITEKKLFEKWTSSEIEQECMECNYLPLCQGGCRASRYTKMQKCFAYKELLPRILIWYMDKLQESKGKTFSE